MNNNWFRFGVGRTLGSSSQVGVGWLPWCGRVVAVSGPCGSCRSCAAWPSVRFGFALVWLGSCLGSCFEVFL